MLANRYRLERRIGVGGMGAVWRALDTQLDTTVAVKVVLPELAEACGPERLLQEARAAARIHHPAVVRVFDFGQHAGGHAYIVMEWLEGSSLRAHLQDEGRLSPERAVALMLPVLEGLGALHARNIIHRDLKPDNVVLARLDGGRLQPKIVDFGIATTRACTERGTASGGTVMGTPEYMSPEQAQACEDLDERSDLWAASVMLYELCADEYPFGGDSGQAVLRNVLRTPAPDLAQRAGVDRTLANIVSRGLAKDRAERWHSAADLARALASWLLTRDVRVDACGASVCTTWGVAQRPSVVIPLVRPTVSKSNRAKAAALALGCLAAGLALGNDGQAETRKLQRGLGSAVVLTVPLVSGDAVAIPSPAPAAEVAAVATEPEPVDPPALRPRRAARQRDEAPRSLPPARTVRPEDVDFGF